MSAVLQSRSNTNTLFGGMLIPSFSLIFSARGRKKARRAGRVSRRATGRRDDRVTETRDLLSEQLRDDRVARRASISRACLRPLRVSWRDVGGRLSPVEMAGRATTTAATTKDVQRSVTAICARPQDPLSRVTAPCAERELGLSECRESHEER